MIYLGNGEDDPGSKPCTTSAFTSHHSLVKKLRKCDYYVLQLSSAYGILPVGTLACRDQSIRSSNLISNRKYNYNIIKYYYHL